jgi:nitrogen fixation NifU-like protein
MDIYREVILDHYKHPRNFGHLKKPDVTANGENVTCGDDISIEILFTKNPASPAGRHKPLTIYGIAFSGQGCAISQASASLLTETVKGKSVEEIMKLHTEDVLSMLGTPLTPTRVKCAVLPLEVIQKALHSHKK